MATMESTKVRAPKQDFFGGFEAAAANNVDGARLLDHLCREFGTAAASVTRLHELEHKGDEITHQMYESLNRVFIPPLDREDIIAIGTGLDNVMDHIYEAADAMLVYNIESPTDVARELAAIVVQCTEGVARQLPLLRSRSAMKQIHEGVVEIHRLENAADTLLRRGLVDLFHGPHDPMKAIAWSRIYETLELITDDCEDVADVLRGLVIKHA